MKGNIQIVLLRHGVPDVPEWGKLRAGELRQWIELYNSAGIKEMAGPPGAAIEIAGYCNTIICSDLSRSFESARVLGAGKVDSIEPIFREAGLPYANFPSPELPAKIWAAFFRGLWLLGYSSNCESFRQAKLRAENGAARLEELAADTGKVLLVGHGFINRFIAKELLRNGWQGPTNPGNKYWAFGIYEYASQ